jgi:hypothetical protein
LSHSLAVLKAFCRSPEISIRAIFFSTHFQYFFLHTLRNAVLEKRSHRVRGHTTTNNNSSASYIGIEILPTHAIPPCSLVLQLPFNLRKKNSF